MAPVISGRTPAPQMPVLPDGFQSEPAHGFLLRKQRDPLAQQYRGHLDNEMIHHVLIQQRGKNGISAHHPDAAVLSQAFYKSLDGISIDCCKSRTGKLSVGKDIIFCGGINRGWIPCFFDLLDRPRPIKVTSIWL